MLEYPVDSRAEYTGRMKKAVAILILLCAVTVSTSAQQKERPNWDRYVPRTLQSIVDAHQNSFAELDSNAPNPNDQIVFSSDSFPSAPTLVFLGQSRPLPGQRKKLIEGWAKTLKITDDLDDVFATEMLFKEGDREYWIPVQKPLLSYFAKEVEIGKPFVAYTIWIGAIKIDNLWDCLFVMNEFHGNEDVSAQKTIE